MAAARLGIRLDLKDASPDELAFFTFCRDTTRASLKSTLQKNRNRIGEVSLYFDLINDDVVNDPRPEASAFSEGQQDFIGITISAARELESEFVRCLDQETVRKRLLSRNPCVRGDGRGDAAPDQSDSIISDRKSYARALTMFALDFMVHHELGHILNGHIRLCAQPGPPGWVEFTAKSCSLPRLEAQALELDADRFATTLGIQGLQIDILQSKLAGAPADAADLFRRSLFFWFLSTSSFFTLNRLGTDDLARLDLREHPLPIVRMDNIVGSVAASAEAKSWNVSSEQLLSIAVEALALVEDVSRANTAGPYTPGRIDILSDEVVQSYVQRLHAAWSSVCPKLEPFRRVPSNCKDVGLI